MGEYNHSFIMLLIICFIAFIAIIGLYSNSDKLKGAAGEFDIVFLIQRAIRKGLNGYVLQNLYVPKADGGTTEIDVLLICTKGIFVFESKNYAGWIFGDDQHKYWTVTLYAGRNWIGFKQTEKHRFYNPIWQNNSHINSLRRVLGNTVPMNSIVVFSNRGELKSISNNSDTRIIQTHDLRQYLSNIKNVYDDMITAEEVDSIYNKLSSYTDTNGEKKQSHLAYIREKQSNPQFCPWCGEPLVVRTARKGSFDGRKFYGCSNYPKF